MSDTPSRRILTVKKPAASGKPSAPSRSAKAGKPPRPAAGGKSFPHNAPRNARSAQAKPPVTASAEIGTPAPLDHLRLQQVLEALPGDSLAASFCEAVAILMQVEAGHSLAEGLLNHVASHRRPQVQDMVYATLRRYGRDDFFLTHLLQRPLDKPEIQNLLRLALYRLESRPENAHTTVDQAVTAAGELSAGKLGGLVNAVLRGFGRRQEELRQALDNDLVASSQHPDWWCARLQAAYPEAWASIVAADNSHPPMALRVNRRQGSRDNYLAKLADAGIATQALSTPPENQASPNDPGILLAQPVTVDKLPGFAGGEVSVQDLGAQRAAAILAPKAGSRVLDACAAPGGKTAHLLENADLDLLALDLSPQRCERIRDTLERLGLNSALNGRLQVQIRPADSRKPNSWWDGRAFDAILADVPCSASGVVRRHPDAKWLRREADIAGFAQTQATILEALWPLLQPGGKLLYATCSLFPEENQQQVARFLTLHPDARCTHQEQLLPQAEHDGFFYALLCKAD
jgi:16S rRNA (cytosine967-C5)-methyltransferase